MKFDAYDILDSIYLIITDSYTKNQSKEDKYDQIVEVIEDYLKEEE